MNLYFDLKLDDEVNLLLPRNLSVKLRIFLPLNRQGRQFMTAPRSPKSPSSLGPTTLQPAGLHIQTNRTLGNLALQPSLSYVTAELLRLFLFHHFQVTHSTSIALSTPLFLRQALPSTTARDFALPVSERVRG